MIGLNKKSKVYHSPRTIVAEVDLEGLICTSVYMKGHVDQLRNKNAEVGEDGNTLEPFYFES